MQGKALNEAANKNCKVLVVGNPCNTNALIAMENAPNIPRKNFHALTRLDENRAKCQLALKAGKFYTNVSRTCIWGNHSTTQVRAARKQSIKLQCAKTHLLQLAQGPELATHTSLGLLAATARRSWVMGVPAWATSGCPAAMFKPEAPAEYAFTYICLCAALQVPDFINARIGGRPAIDVIQDMKWFKEEFTPTVAQRGGALIKKWGRSSAASTAVSIADAIRSLVTPTAPGDCFSTAVCTDGNPYGIKEGLIFSMPCRWVMLAGLLVDPVLVVPLMLRVEMGSLLQQQQHHHHQHQQRCSAGVTQLPGFLWFVDGRPHQ
jgi:hypothetical protein